MSNIDKQALNQEKIEWLNKLADMEYCKSNPGHWLMSLKDTNMLAKLALRSVALLDELDAKDRRIAELQAPAPELKMAHLINKFYERYPLAEFKSDTERSAALGYFMAGAELQCFGEFINYAELMGDE
ncbi:hypothetical protein [Enterobacter hormaechei]|uniref:hypothetical protein n=1 Tax=Enterobacter hormaechei TaxID=158836 RepID=UPI003906725A